MNGAEGHKQGWEVRKYWGGRKQKTNKHIGGFAVFMGL